ncbi:Topoisomerase 1-associated factor 1 [Coniosporium apollinis]|uniref:Topoisomerase 1-associated factor 1 n=1 Tax=Coniosporium apollinis TaxID=61459 RepID=A0ABQ9P5F0_9PEZI|nr:Topoisomerase 1-associated factor 1 [Coniosporium apollinis]
MSLDEWVTPTVDPEIRAFVYSIVSAIGGTSADEDGTYVLGDDALACLKDVRRWIKGFDQKQNRFDVQRCLAEANFVKGDLLEIMAKWPENSMEDPLKYKAGYKRDILHHDRANVLERAVRLALPAMAVPRKEREPRDDGVIRIALYFIRNVAMISIPANAAYDGDEAEISRSATISTFHAQNVFQLLLTVASSMGDEFVEQDVILLEILFHLLKGVDVEKLFMEEKARTQANTQALREMMQKEKAMLSGYARHAPTRHNRFGTMIWVKRADERVSTVSGQTFLGKDQKIMEQMDGSKKWNKPRLRNRNVEENEQKEFDIKVHLDAPARKQLRSFVEEFLDSSFNPLFTHLRKAIEREAHRVEGVHSMQYFYLISWFLQAECARRRQIQKNAAAKQASTTPANPDDESFALIAGVMNQETFVLLNRFMQRSQDDKSWQDLNAGMKCFTQILLTVQEMSESSAEDDQDIAENIQNRIFYEETTHDRIIYILRNYKDQGFGYLDACTELSHVFLRMLERYSKQNVDLQVRSRRRARRKKNADAQANGEANADEEHAEEAEEVADAQRTTTERKFDFARFSAKFSTQACVNTFVAFTKYYRDLTNDQLKRAHRFFYRVAFKQDLAMILYRVDILHLFNKMVKGPEGLSTGMPVFQDWQELVRQLFRKVIKKVQERPELMVEMLFSKIPNTMFYLEQGYEREVPTRAPRAPAELEVKPGMEKKDQIGVAVSVLVNQNKSDALAWIKTVLTSAVDERQAWEAEAEARKVTSEPQNPHYTPEAPTEQTTTAKPPSILVKPDTAARRTALFKDNKLRLLLTLLGFERLGLDDDPLALWIIPSDLTAAALVENLDLMRRFEFDPPVYEGGKSAEDFLRSKAAAARKRAAYDDDSDGDEEGASAGEEEILFPAGGPTNRRSEVLEQLKSKRRRLRHKADEEPDEAEKERRAEARRKADEEKRRKIKSDLMVHESDDETDEERDRGFFAKEEERRKNAGRSILKALTSGKRGEKVLGKRKGRAGREAEKGGRKKKQHKSLFSDPEESDEGSGRSASAALSVASSPGPAMRLESDSDEDADMTDTPLSSQQPAPTRVGQRGSPAGLSRDPLAAKSANVDVVVQDADSEDEEDVPIHKPVVRRNVRAGFVIDSDSE